MFGEYELNRIYQRDCIEGMALIPDKSVDMILCDLPYGTTRNKWDSVIPLSELWEQYERVIKDSGAIVLTAQTPFDKILGVSNLKLLRYELIWEKSKSTGYLNARRMPMKSHENVLVFYKKMPSYTPQLTKGSPYKNRHKPGDTGDNYGENKKVYSFDNKGTRFPRSVLKFNSVLSLEQEHPTQKPVALFEYLIRTYTNEGDVVLDNCMGSGTTAIAAINTGRKFIGFETEPKYVEIANQRIERLKEAA
ncbi:DNA-methyltransferase [Brevibacillus daliensis]|uniref:DNA-methyltransferase n=1 Tax=Brevibacillus daliensis TaxID=2892995 RepID=UPI001E301D07|nr:site-specific DNA-methyltransferase [Brevibacillus daliensis]